MRNIFLGGLLTAAIFTGCTKARDTQPDSESNSNTSNSGNIEHLSKLVLSTAGVPGDTTYLTYNADGMLDKTKNSKFTKRFFYDGGKLIRTENKSTLNGVEIKTDEHFIYSGGRLVRKELSSNTVDSAYRMIAYDSLVYDGNHVKEVFQFAVRPHGWVNEKEISTHLIVKWKNNNVDSVYTYDKNPPEHLAWVETYTYDDQPNYLNVGAGKILALLYSDYYTLSGNNVQTAKLTGYSVSTVTVPTIINRSFTYELNEKNLLAKLGVLIPQRQEQPSIVTRYIYE